MSAVGPECQEGYYCTSGATSDTQTLCSAGSYCIAGSQDPTLCPAGTFSNTEGLTAESECTACTNGFYCPLSGNVFNCLMFRSSWFTGFR